MRIRQKVMDMVELKKQYNELDDMKRIKKKSIISSKNMYLHKLSQREKNEQEVSKRPREVVCDSFIYLSS